MAINSIFPQARELLVNYDWIDILSATGYITFDGINAVDSTGDKYILLDHTAAAGAFGNDNRSPVPAQDATSFITVVGGGGVGPTRCINISFDLSAFQLPRTVEGNAFVGLTLGADVSVDVSDVQVKAIFKKNTTTIVTTSSEIRDLSSNTENSFALKLVVPKTKFKKGDYIKLTIEVWSTDSDDIGLFHIPDNTAHSGSTRVANGSAGNTRLSLAVPFKLDFM